jgi:hypothetical protein
MRREENRGHVQLTSTNNKNQHLNFILAVEKIHEDLLTLAIKSFP